ncbi:hypothetical protein [Senegalimassilia anaerobia]|uniref:hypothetical protein n=1 Tax=Senegalimassilia anaerobia TaxID=1473216 RepID=UPI003AF1B9D9
MRCGIGRPPGRMSVVDWVLGRPKKEQADDFACESTDLPPYTEPEPPSVATARSP